MNIEECLSAQRGTLVRNREGDLGVIENTGMKAYGTLFVRFQHGDLLTCRYQDLTVVPEVSNVV